MNDSSANPNLKSELPIASSETATSGCCKAGTMGALLVNRWTVGVLLVAALVSTGMVGYMAGQNQSQQTPSVYFPPIDATAAVSSDKFSMATGMVSDRAEGVFVLDHNSGLLQCSVLYPRVGKFMGLFTTNVADALAAGGKGGKYIMATGLADFPNSSNRPAAASVIYVLDTATGNYACYGIPFNRIAMNSNQRQQNSLVLIATGTANPVVDRDSLQ